MLPATHQRLHQPDLRPAKLVLFAINLHKNFVDKKCVAVTPDVSVLASDYKEHQT